VYTSSIGEHEYSVRTIWYEATMKIFVVSPKHFAEATLVIIGNELVLIAVVYLHLLLLGARLA
jgi:hypothetical protein